jgi:hypothetical protein
MGMIDKFLEEVAPGYKRELARVNIVGGGDKPFYCAQMRSFWKEGGGGDAVVAETFGLRSLLVDAEPQKMSAAGAARDLLQPTLLRVHARPRDFGEESDGVRSRELFLWAPGTSVQGALREETAVSDLIVAPTGTWPDQTSVNIRLPHLRLVEGRYRVQLELTGALARFLDFNPATNTLFGGLQIEVANEAGTRLVAATLVPRGIEMRGKLPDPTRDFPGGQPDSSIDAVFRLECDTGRPGGPAYLIRLVDVDKPQEQAINAVEGRIAAAFASLGMDSAPIAIRYDKRPKVPPLLWPLKLDGKALRLIDTQGGGDFDMAIDRFAIDVRVRTTQDLQDEEHGLATIFAGNVIWRRTATPAVELIVEAGDEALIDDDQIRVAFTRVADSWATTMSDVTERPFWAPLSPIAERLLGLYRAARAVDDGIGHAPYLFMPIHEGWLQIALPAPAPSAQQPTATELKSGSAMSGRITVSHRGVLTRGLVLDDAGAIRISIGWRNSDGMFRPSTIRLEAGEPQGQLLGFLFAAEASPTAREALPTLRGGSAATRDLPLWFGGQPPAPYMQGVFTWKQATDAFTAIIGTEVPPGFSAEPTAAIEGPKAIAWLSAGVSPFITNFPLTRGLPSAPEPSLSRGLLPREITSRTFQLRSEYAAGADVLPHFSAQTQHWFGVFQTEGAAFRDDTLVLPTLAGVEFQPSGKEAPDANVFMTALRFDLPILDELFAWSDPPKRSAQPATEAGDDGGRDISLPTALEPFRLAEIWRRNRDRMALTRTQAAHATGWFPAGQAVTQTVSSLIATYRWTPQIEIHAHAPGDPFGFYRLEGEEYRLGQAAEGMGGDAPVSFGITDADDEIAVGGGVFEVAGFAANLYKAPRWGTDLLWDSRGFAVAPEATNGERIAAFRQKGSGGFQARKLTLKTLTRPEIIELGAKTGEWGFTAPLEFFARDLPLDGSVFDGEANPVEMTRGTNGQAFDQADFPLSLHEWRLFESVDGDQLRRHDIRWGPFVFKPLRLARAEFGEEGQPAALSVVGSLRLGQVHDPKPDGPYGPDDVYLRGDLFRLSLTQADGIWAYQWMGVEAESGSELGKISFLDRSTSIELPVELTTPPSRHFLRSVAKVAATLTVDIVAKSASFQARLFGSDCRLDGIKVTPAADGFTMEAAAAPPTASGDTGAFFIPSKIVISVDRGGRRELEIDGQMLVMPMPKREAVQLDASEALLALGPSSFRWLGVSAEGDNEIAIDHRTGLFRWSRILDAPAGEPLLQLGAETLRISAAAALVAAEREIVTQLGAVDMSSAWMRIAAVDQQTPEHAIDHTLLAATDSGREHAIEVSWTKRVTSPIQWPIGQVCASDYAPLPPEWLDPAAANHANRSRIITIKNDQDSRVEHVVQLHLRRHRIDADQLRMAGGMPTPAKPLRLLAIVDHTLTGPRGTRSAHWTSLDHVVITSPSLLAEEVQASTFGPRNRSGKYRAESHPEIDHGGIVPLDLAAAGFHDRFLAGQLWKKGDRTAIIIGAAVTQFPIRSEPGTAYVAVVPWLDMSGAAKLNAESGTWRVAAADLWPATAARTSAAIANVVIARDLDGTAIERQFGEGRFAPKEAPLDSGATQVVPVEQAYFEKWNGAAQKMEPTDLTAAPFFIRAMMAIDARWRADSGGVPDGGYDWRAVTLQAGRFLKKHGGKPLAPAVPALSVTVRAESGPVAATMACGAEPMAVASLVVLSRTRATWLPGYRRIPPGRQDGPSRPDRAPGTGRDGGGRGPGRPFRGALSRGARESACLCLAVGRAGTEHRPHRKRSYRARHGYQPVRRTRMADIDRRRQPSQLLSHARQ